MDDIIDSILELAQPIFDFVDEYLWQIAVIAVLALLALVLDYLSIVELGFV